MVSGTPLPQTHDLCLTGLTGKVIFPDVIGHCHPGYHPRFLNGIPK